MILNKPLHLILYITILTFLGCGDSDSYYTPDANVTNSSTLNITVLPITKERTTTYTIYDLIININDVKQTTYLKFRVTPDSVSLGNIEDVITVTDDTQIVLTIKVESKDVKMQISTSIDNSNFTENSSIVLQKNIQIPPSTSTPGNTDSSTPSTTQTTTLGSSVTYSGTYVGYGNGCPITGNISFTFYFLKNLIYINSSNINGGGTTFMTHAYHDDNFFDSTDEKGVKWSGVGVIEGDTLTGSFNSGSYNQAPSICSGDFEIKK